MAKRGKKILRNEGGAKTADTRVNKPPSTKPAAAKFSTYLSIDKPRTLSLTQLAMKPIPLVPRQWRQEAIHIAAVFIAVLTLYGYTTPSLVTLEDDGLFISNLHFFGVAHPPGYPIHTLLGSIFYHLLPFGTPAFKGHLFSGFAGAVTCAAIYAIIAMLVRGRIFAYFGGLAYGASETFWSQAIIAEVYTLNAMFFFIIMALCLRYAGHNGRSGATHRRLFVAITVIYGLGLANHYPLLGLGSIGLGMMVLSQIGNIIPRILLGVGGILLGIVPPYLLMVWRSGYEVAANPANFYGPIGLWGLNEKDKVTDFGFYFFRSGYSGVDNQAGVDWLDKFSFAEQLSNDMLWQFTPLGLAFVIIGFLVLIFSRYFWLWCALSVSWFMSSFLLVYLLNFQAEYIWLAAFRVYHLLAFGIMAIWLAVGAAWLVDRFKMIPLIARQGLGVLLLCSVVGASLATHWEKNNRRDYRWAHDLAVAKLNSVEKNAVLFTFDDLDLPVGYLYFVEGLRPDLKVYNDQGLVYGDRLFSPLTPDHSDSGVSKNHILRSFIDQVDRPIYYHPARADLYRHPRYGSDLVGFFRRVNREGPHQRIILSDFMKQWMTENVDKKRKITDLWTRQHYFSIVTQILTSLQAAKAHGAVLDEQWNELLEKGKEINPLFRISHNIQSIRAQRMSPESMKKELEWIKTFSPSDEPLLNSSMRSSFYWQKGWLARQLNDDSVSIEKTWRQGQAEDESKNNLATQELLSLYYNEERYCEFIALMEESHPSDKEDKKIPVRLLSLLRKARAKGKCS